MNRRSFLKLLSFSPLAFLLSKGEAGERYGKSPIVEELIPAARELNGLTIEKIKECRDELIEAETKWDDSESIENLLAEERERINKVGNL